MRILLLATLLILTQRVAQAQQEGEITHNLFGRSVEGEVVILAAGFSQSGGGQFWVGRPEIKADSISFTGRLGDHWGTYAVDKVRLRSGEEKGPPTEGIGTALVYIGGILGGMVGAVAVGVDEDEYGNQVTKAKNWVGMFGGMIAGALPGYFVGNIKHPFRYIHLPDGRTVRAKDDDFMLDLRRQIRRARGTAWHVLPMRDGAGLGVSYTF